MQRAWSKSIRSQWLLSQAGRLFTADRKIKKNRKLLKRIDSDLARVGPSLTVAYLIFFLVIPGGSLQPVEISAAFGGLFCALAAYTLLLGQKFEQIYGAGPRRWRERMLISILCTSALWICFVVIMHRSSSSDTVQLLLYGLTLGISSYLALVLIAYMVVVKLVLAMTLIPLGILWLFETGLAAQIICIATLLYSVLLTMEVSRLNAVFWQNYENKQNLRTSIRALTQAQRSEGRELEAKYKTLFGIGHEFRIPINGIVGMLSLLKKSALTIEQQEQLDVADGSAQQLLSLVDLLLEQSEIGSSTLLLEQTVFNLNKEIDTCVEQLTPLAAERGIELWVVYERDMPHRVKGDSNRIKQILTNLLINVIKVNQQNKVIILVDMQRERDKEGWLKIEFFDEDFTLARFESNKLVNQFSRAGQQQAIKTGQLGSVISRELAKSMGGDVGLSKTSDRASLWFTAKLGVSSQQIRSFSPHPKIRSKRVALVGFSQWAARSLALILENWSMQISLSADFDSMTDEGEADLLILDHAIPIPAFLSVPIIRMIPFQQLEQHSAQQDRVGTLTIPVIEEQLHQKIVEILGLRSPHQAKGPDAEEKWRQGLSKEMTILLVEDDRTNQLTTEKMLHKLGYRVDIANNGDEALAKLGQMDFDLVLMDCQLPGMSGFETAAEMKRQASAVKPPILALTANVQKGEEARCIAAGMDGYLAKPVHVDDLDVKLRQFLI